MRAALDGANVDGIAVRLGLARNTVYLRPRRFAARGRAGPEDQPRGGRPPAYPREQVGEIVAAALTARQTLGLPFQSRASTGWSRI